MTPIEVRFWSKVLVTPGCWEWQGSLTSAGYGELGRGRRGEGQVLAHRLSYELHVGPIPDGLQVDHLCRNRACVFWGHMEVVSHAVNTLRGVGASAVNARKTHCVRGHEFVVPNLYVDSQGRRQCRECSRIRDARKRARRSQGATVRP